MSKELTKEETDAGTTWLNKPNEDCTCKIRRPWAKHQMYWEIIDRSGCKKHDLFSTPEGRRKLFDPIMTAKYAQESLREYRKSRGIRDVQP